MEKETKKQNLIEICRSFAYKLNLGNYQSADFFCSQKMEVLENEAEETSKKLWHFCKTMVEKDVNEYINSHLPPDQQIIELDKANEGINL